VLVHGYDSPPYRTHEQAPKNITNNMPRAKKEVEVVEKVEESQEKIAYRAVIAAYKERNPEKYEVKREELEAKLAKL